MDDITPQYVEPTTGNEQRKKNIRNILLLVIAILLVLGGIYVVYGMLNKGKTSTSGGVAFPTGGNIIQTGVSEVGQPTTSGGTGAENQGVATPKLRELYKGPLAGYTLLSDDYTILGFDRLKGRLVEINTNTGISNIVNDQPILQVHDALFLGDSGLILRSLDNRDVIKSRLYTITKQSGADFPLMLSEPIELSDDILELAASPDQKKVVIVIKDPLGANIDVLDVASQKLTRQATLPIAEWMPTIQNDGTVYLSAKASRFAKSGTYRVSNGTLILSIRGNTGQTTLLSPMGDVAYSAALYGDQFTAQLSVPDPSSLLDPTILSFATIAEKCAWAKTGDAIYCGAPDVVYPNTPDDWYKGITHSSDSLREFDLVAHKEIFLVNPVTYKATIDMVNLLPANNAIYFKNKTDEHLWSYQLDVNSTSSQSNTSTTTQNNTQP
jgi:hypothetical protein